MKKNRAKSDDKLATRLLMAEFRSELMLACVFLTKIKFSPIELSTLYGHDYDFGDSVTSLVYLKALRLVCDEYQGDDSLVMGVLLGDDREANAVVAKQMRARPRKGFTFRQYRSWKASL